MSNKVPKIIFIVPYRSRMQEANHFKIYMNRYIMEDYKEGDYQIFFVHQFDSRPFNRGAMKNIGFIAMKEKYPEDYKNITFVFAFAFELALAFLRILTFIISLLA